MSIPTTDSIETTQTIEDETTKWIFFPTPPDINIDVPNSNYMFFSIYAYCLVVFIVFISLYLAKAAHRRYGLSHQSLARQQGARNANSVQASSRVPKAEDDLPPSYQEVVQAQLNAKHLLPIVEEGTAGASSNSISNNGSCLTLATELGTSQNNLSNSNTRIDFIPPPPPYENSITQYPRNN